MLLFNWCKVKNIDGVDWIEVDPNFVYPKYIQELGYNINNITQCQLEIARHCLTKDIKALLSIQSIKILRLLILKDERWALKHFPIGDLLTSNLIASEYNRIRS